MSQSDLHPACHWIVEGFVGHAVKHRGPIMVEAYCGRSLHGPVVEDKPARICGYCVKAWRAEQQKRRDAEQTQGRLF